MTTLAFRRFRVLLGVLIVAMLLPPVPSSALIAVVTLTDTNQEFVAGLSFLRTGLAAPNPGGVQLLPALNYRQFLPSLSKLPQKLADFGVVSYGKQIFVIGGRSVKPQTDPPQVGDPVTAFYSTQLITPTDGGIATWTDYSSQGLQLPLGLAGAGVTIARTSGGVFLYVIGGLTAAGNSVLSSNTIYYSRLTGPNANGLYTPGAWQSIIEDPNNLGRGLPLPHPAGRFGGGAAELNVVVESIGTQPTMYLFGGRNRTANSSFVFTERFMDTVYKSPINADGTLQGWTLVDNIKSVDSGGVATRIGDDTFQTGLAGTTAITSTNPENGLRAVYLIAGRNNPTNSESRVFNALINNDGTLTWKRTSNVQGSLVFHSSVAANGAVFAIGGSQNAESSAPAPLNSIQAALVGDDLGIQSPADPQLSSFFRLDNALGTTNFRQNHGNATIDAGENGRWVYVIGGRAGLTASETPSVASDEVFIGRFGYAGDSLNPLYFKSGNYYSKPFQYSAGTLFKEMRWHTSIPANTSIQMGYRIANDLETLGTTPYITGPLLLSAAGDNVFRFPNNITGQYFQFVARLGTENQNTSPILDRVQIQIDKTGFPNATPQVSIPANFATSLAQAPDVAVKNISPPDGMAVLNASDDAGPPKSPNFFVDFYIKPAGDTTKPQRGDLGQVYASVQKSDLPAGSSYTIPSSSWRPSSCPALPCPAVDWSALFPPGTYNVFVMVDSIPQSNLDANPFGYLEEAESSTPTANNGEGDNVFGPFTVTVISSRYIYLPLVQRLGLGQLPVYLPVIRR